MMDGILTQDASASCLAVLEAVCAEMAGGYPRSAVGPHWPSYSVDVRSGRAD